MNGGDGMAGKGGGCEIKKNGLVVITRLTVTSTLAKEEVVQQELGLSWRGCWTIGGEDQHGLLADRTMEDGDIGR